MILCIDAGNTRIKFGLRAEGSWLLRDALTHEFLPELADYIGRYRHQPTRLLACSVAGEQANATIEALGARWQLPVEWLKSQPAGYGVRNTYTSPTQLGNDRWAALIGARAVHSAPCIVVMAGTATTIDGLDGAGNFLGGLILPGLSLMHSALARNTAGLPLAQGTYRAWPGTTDDAIVSGALTATAGAIERLRTQLDPQATCLLSGGAADALLPLLAEPVTLHPDLVLDGLARVAEAAAT